MIITMPINAENIGVFVAENHKGIENHKRAAKHHVEAAKHHYDAAKYHEVGEHGKAAQSTIKALGHLHYIQEAIREDTTHHVLYI